jgi:hypothetical protein
MHMENTSGHGEFAQIPEEIRGWNWGAFWLTWIWGIANKCYVALFALIPLVGIPAAIYLGIKGNELAWRNRYWSDIQEFKATQRSWGIGGFVIAIVIFSLMALQIIHTNKINKRTDKITKQVISIISENKEVKNLLGNNYSIAFRPGIASVQTGMETVPIYLMIIIKTDRGIIWVYADLDKNYNITQIKVSPPNDGEDITISVVNRKK